jgi:hypothetical protein
LVRGFLVGLILIPALAISVLSLRPGGLRSQFRNIARRLKLALLLAGVYLVVSAGIRLLFPRSSTGDFVIVGVALVLTLVFVFLSQDRQFER